MDNITISILDVQEAWTGTAQVCIDQTQYTELGIKIMVTIGLAFLLGFVCDEIIKFLLKNNNKKTGKLKDYDWRLK